MVKQMLQSLSAAFLLFSYGVVAAATPGAEPGEPESSAHVVSDEVEAGGEPLAEAAIPPQVQQGPQVHPEGGYCYAGSHPVDTRVEASESFHAATGSHLHPYPPVDLRLFSFHDGCYHFIGDPRDFGYQGQAYQYYGAHPVPTGHQWCFMIGGHFHTWQPWSPYFVTVGPWFYWQGAYDPFFWSYWPYYAFFYQNYYPRYYAYGRFSRAGSGARTAPPIRRIPSQPAGVRPHPSRPGTVSRTPPRNQAPRPASGSGLGAPRTPPRTAPNNYRSPNTAPSRGVMPSRGAGPSRGFTPSRGFAPSRGFGGGSRGMPRVSPRR